MLQALVICDKHDSEADKTKLFQELESQGIRPFVSDSMRIDPILAAISQMDSAKPFLYYPNIWTRYDNAASVLEYHESNPGFEALIIDGERISFFPHRVKVYASTFVINSDIMGTKDTYTFIVTNCHRHIIKPVAKPFPIFMYSHNRAPYFQLALNALKHSLHEDTSNIKLFLNEPTEDVLKVAKSSGADLFVIEKNSFYSAINLAVQWFMPEKFMVFEDDFILPPNVNHYFPNWYEQFSQRLDKFDMVGWAPITENGPPIHRFQRQSSEHTFGDWIYHDSNPKPLLLGQGLAVNYSHWKSALMAHPSIWQTPLDSDLHKGNPTYCTPALRGYHIGWNQDMDGLNVKHENFFPPLENTVTHLQTGERRTISLNALTTSQLV